MVIIYRSIPLMSMLENALFYAVFVPSLQCLSTAVLVTKVLATAPPTLVAASVTPPALRSHTHLPANLLLKTCSSMSSLLSVAVGSILRVP